MLSGRARNYKAEQTTRMVEPSCLRRIVCPAKRDVAKVSILDSMSLIQQDHSVPVSSYWC
jgi:hypothetical protein